MLFQPGRRSFRPWREKMPPDGATAEQNSVGVDAGNGLFRGPAQVLGRVSLNPGVPDHSGGRPSRIRYMVRMEMSNRSAACATVKRSRWMISNRSLYIP